MSELLDAADEYVHRGLAVLALTGKTPNTKVHTRWSRDAAIDSDTTHEAMSYAMNHEDTTGIAILTGEPYYVVDIDGPGGAKQWLEIVGRENLMLDTWVAQTSRGMHIWVHDLVAEYPTTKLGDLLDFKGRGGYVAAPPSLHPSGARYSWLQAPSEANVMEMPDPLRDLLIQYKRDREQAMLNKQMRRQVARADRVPGLIYNEPSFEGIIETVRDAAEGNRNNVLFWAAATMRDDGADEEDFEQLLDTAIKGGLSRWEARRTIQSAMSSAR